MATYRLTIGDDTRNGTNDDDVFDGYPEDDELGASGGTDTLSGRGGNDTFLLGQPASPHGGLIDGGTGTDTVRAYGFDLGSFTFQNVEILSVEYFEFSARLDQLNAFSTITNSGPAASSIMFYLQGAGGTLDLSSRMAAGRSVSLNAEGLSSGLTATGTAVSDEFRGSHLNDEIHGGDGADIFLAQHADASVGGTDLLFGDGGADTFYVRNQAGTIHGGAGTDTVVAYQFQSGPSDIFGDLGEATFVSIERLVTGARTTFASLEQINSFARISSGADQTVRLSLSETAGGVIDFSGRVTVPGESVSFSARNATSAVDVTGTARDDVLVGSSFADRLTGGAGADLLAGADFIAGAMGRDTLLGGAGGDTYHVDLTDTVVETLTGAAGGIDTVQSFTSFDLASTRVQGEVENLTLLGYLGHESVNSYGYGNALDNAITGNGGNNRIDGRAGADLMAGRGGNDTYLVDDLGDRVEEQGGEGTDLVLSSVDFDLGAGTPETSFVERLTLTGTASINAFGNGLDNRLTGNDGNNVLDGRGGRDIMTGGRGNDIYYVDTAGDRVIEDNAPGIDRVFSSVSFNLTGQFVEHLTLVGSGAMNGVGNQLNNRIVGGAGNNILNGGLGTDTMTGGAGGDRFVFNTALTPANVDTITDFNVDHDTIGLDDAIFSALSGVGVLDTAEFAWTLDGEAADATDRIVYDASSGNLFYDADGSGAGGKLLFATIAPHLAGLTNADFVVV